MVRVAPTARFPFKWETDVPMKPCPDKGCGETHGGHLAVGAEPPQGSEKGCLIIGIVSDLGDGALRLTPEEAFAFLDDVAIAAGVMIGMDTSQAIGFLADLQGVVSSAFDTAEEEASRE